MKLIDILSRDRNEENLQVLNLLPFKKENIPHSYFSTGMHPWESDEFNYLEMEKRLTSLKDNPYFFALGEIGLDRIKGANFKKQEIVFKSMLDLANKHEIKRLIIHCVKAYEEIFKIIKEKKYQGIFIFHDFNAGQEITKKLVKNKNIFFSLGKNFLREESKINQTISLIPSERILTETDEGNPLFQTYQKLENLKGDKIKKIIYQNFKGLLII